MKVSAVKHHLKIKPKSILENNIDQQQSLTEIDMSPSALADFAKSADKFGVRAGFEAELLFTGIPPQGSGGESEPDYEGTDERIRSSTELSDLQDFFSETVSSNNRVWARMEEAYLDGVFEKAQEFVDENIDERVRERVLDEVSEDDRLYNYLSSNGHSDEDIEKIIAAGNDAPQWSIFSKYSEQTAYAEENPLYQLWKEAQDAVEEELETEIESMREDVEEELRDEFMSTNEYYIGEWLNDQGIDFMSELASEYELDWPHWTENEEFEAFDENEMAYAAAKLEDMVGMDVRVSGGYHNARRDDNSYIIEPDGSLQPEDSDEHGSAEIVSPPMPLNQMVDHIRKVIEWAQDHSGYTNSSTGLHVGVSLPDMSRVDYVKLAILLGDQYVLRTFDREFNSFTQSVFKKIASSRNEQTIAQAVDALKTGMVGVASTALKYTVFSSSGTTQKYVSLNWKNQYIEFRSMGGDYINDIDKIVNTIYRYVRAIVSSADPDMDRKEYLTKLYKIVQTANSDLNSADAIKPVNMIITKFMAGEIGKDTIQQYKKYFQQAAQVRKDPNAAKPAHPEGEMTRWKVNANYPGTTLLVVRARNRDDAIAKAIAMNKSYAKVPKDQITTDPYDRTVTATVGAPQPAGRTGEFTGQWEIRDSQGRELHTFGGIGNNQADANRFAAGWLGRNRPGMIGQEVEVVPVMR